MSDPEGQDENRQREDVRQLTDEVVRNLRWRFWALSAVVTLLGYFGVKEIVRGVTETEIRAAQRAAIVAEESAKKTTTATDTATKQAEAYSETVGALRDEAAKVQQQFLAVKNQLEADRGNLKASVDRGDQELRARIGRLDELVTRLAQESQTSRQALETYRKDLQKLATTAEAERKRFADNSKYSVVVYSVAPTRDLATRAQALLSEIGYRVSVTDLTNAAYFWKQLPFKFPATPTVNTIQYSPGREPKATEVKGTPGPFHQHSRDKRGPDRR
jgi:hypothetical protein